MIELLFPAVPYADGFIQEFIELIFDLRRLALDKVFTEPIQVLRVVLQPIFDPLKKLIPELKIVESTQRKQKYIPTSKNPRQLIHRGSLFYLNSKTIQLLNWNKGYAEPDIDEVVAAGTAVAPVR